MLMLIGERTVDKEKLDIFDRIMLLPVLRIFNSFYKKHKSVLLYIFFGGCTTLISIGTFVLFGSYCKLNELIANVLSWVLAVLFAYVANRIWVFTSRVKGMQAVKEMLAFFAGRLTTLGIEELLLLVFVTLLSFNSVIVKTAAQVIVLLLNYFISKFVIFKHKGR